MRTSALPTIPPIYKDPTPPMDPLTGAKAPAVGISSDGRIIYETHVPDLKATKAARTQATDPLTGSPVYRKDIYGERYPVMVGEEVFKAVKVLVRRKPNGSNRIEEYREPSQAEVQADAKKRAVKQFGDELAEVATERGLSPRELVDRLLGALAPEADEDEPNPDEPQGPQRLPLDPNDALFGIHIVNKGGGWYNVLADGVEVSNNNLRKSDAEELATLYREERAG